MKVKEHEMRFGYTTDDDGVHIFCSCGADIKLQSDDDPWSALDLARAHEIGMPVTSTRLLVTLGGI